MDGPTIITALQLFAAFVWATVIAMRAPAVWRIVQGAPRSVIDFYSAIIVGIGAMQTGFALRWWLYPEAKADMLPGELALWASLYAVSAMIAAASHAVPRHAE